MAFSSNFFLFAFMPAALALYFATPAGSRNPLLLVISLLFYSFDSGWMAWILIVSILLNHGAAKALVSLQGRPRLLIFVGAVIANLVLLLHYKYTSLIWDINTPA